MSANRSSKRYPQLICPVINTKLINGPLCIDYQIICYAIPIKPLIDHPVIVHKIYIRYLIRQYSRHPLHEVPLYYKNCKKTFKKSLLIRFERMFITTIYNFNGSYAHKDLNKNFNKYYEPGVSQFFCCLFKVRRHAIGCINHDIVCSGPLLQATYEIIPLHSSRIR